ncbi:hypothetical protein F4776DRAFT_36713 [Hypoxylon sp. NC0597]|nr:hypothetical protein F4776DRAFT_36713 [Hypoxylon sp. NC0597]
MPFSICSFVSCTCASYAFRFTYRLTFSRFARFNKTYIHDVHTRVRRNCPRISSLVHLPCIGLGGSTDLLMGTFIPTEYIFSLCRLQEYDHAPYKHGSGIQENKHINSRHVHRLSHLPREATSIHIRAGTYRAARGPNNQLYRWKLMRSVTPTGYGKPPSLTMLSCQRGWVTWGDLVSAGTNPE